MVAQSRPFKSPGASNPISFSGSAARTAETCGSGTTLVVAGRLGRRWAGIDESPVACDTARTRLAAIPHPSR
jgi:hypothetical protein